MNIYFDNAATTAIKPEIVAKAVYDCLSKGIYGNPSRGAHTYSINSFQLIYETRKLLKEFFNARSDENIAFASNITAGLNMVLKGILKEKDHVITTDYEHNSVLRPLYQLEEEGIEVDRVHFKKPLGTIDYEDFTRLLKPNTRALVCNHGSNVIGNLIDIKRLGAFCREHDLIFIVDTAQTAGVFPIDMEDMNIDILCFTGHKSLYGPQGTGGVIINREDLSIKPLMSGGSGSNSFSHSQPSEMPSLLESGTMNTHGIAGLKAGLSYVMDQGLDSLREKQQNLAKIFYEALKDQEKLTFYGDYSTDERSAIVALNILDIPSSEVAGLLDEKYGIAVRGGAHCAPLIHEGMGTKDQGIVRFSFSSMNTEEEVYKGIEAVKALIKLT